MNKNHYILIAAFLVSFGVGFGVTKLVRHSSSSNGSGTEMTASSDSLSSKGQGVADANVGDRDKTVAPTGRVDETSPKEISSVSLRVKTPKLRSNGTYSFSVSPRELPKGASVIYELKNGAKTVKVSSTGDFSGVAPATGKYTVVAKDKSTGKVLAHVNVAGVGKTEKEGKRMSASQFQALLCNPNDHSLLGGRNPMVAKSISFHSSGDRARDVQDIRDKLSLGIWSSVTVISVGYDEQGRINSASIRVTK